MTTIFDVATCIGCGCDDDHACMQGCGWLRVNRHIGRGVCTSCPDKLRTWDEGEYSLPRSSVPIATNPGCSIATIPILAPNSWPLRRKR